MEFKFKEGTYEIISNIVSVEVQDKNRVSVKMQGKKGRVGVWEPGDPTDYVMFYPLGEEPSSICIRKEDIKRVN